MAAPPTTLERTDGRRVAYAEYGDPAGHPVFYCHGTPGSRLEPGCGSLPSGVRLIAPDRPGFGHSDPWPGRTWLDGADDVAALADHLGLARFSMLGFSGGAPHALACGYRLSQRIERIGIVSGLAPFAGVGGPPASTRAYYEAVQADPGALLAALTEQVPDTRALWAVMCGALPPADRRVFDRPLIAEAYRRNLEEAMRQGVRAIVTELGLAAARWPFSLERIQRPVQLWQGNDDANTPPVMGRHLADMLPVCEARFLSGRGHFFLFRHWRRVLVRLRRAA